MILDLSSMPMKELVSESIKRIITKLITFVYESVSIVDLPNSHSSFFEKLHHFLIMFKISEG